MVIYYVYLFMILYNIYIYIYIYNIIGKKIDEVFIGSCMTNIGHFRAAGIIYI